MGLFNKLFSGSNEPKETKVLPWIALNELEQLQVILKKSQAKTQFIFKHSTRCGISRMVMNQFVESYGFSESEFDLYYLDLLNYRNISNEVAAKFQVMHESPQLLVIKNATTVAHESHDAINSLDLRSFL